MANKYYINIFEKFLRNQATEEEIGLLQSIVRSDKNIQRMFEDKLAMSNPMMDNDLKERIFGNIGNDIRKNNKTTSIARNWKKTLQWAAIFILPVLSALSVYYITQNQKSPNHPTMVTAQNGEKAEVVLPDGSKVWINSGSTLTYEADFNKKSRPVYLEGEAYFEVAKDKKRPFIVKTQWMDVEALGTAFNVSAYEDEQYVASVLLEGKIKINALGQERILAENERVTVDKTHRELSTDMVYASDFVQWKSGNLYFENRSFEEIANTLSRIFNVEIQFASEKLRSIRFSGTLGNSSIRNALDILSLTSSMHYEMNGTVIELYYKE